MITNFTSSINTTRTIQIILFHLTNTIIDVIGKSYIDNVYCKVSLGDNEQLTDVAKDNLINGNVVQNGAGAPQVPTLIWNSTMQFPIRNINNETLKIDVYEMCLFTPDGG